MLYNGWVLSLSCAAAMMARGYRTHAAAVNDKNIVGSHKYAINISNGRYQCNKKKLL